MHYSSDPAASDFGGAEVCRGFNTGAVVRRRRAIVRAGRECGIKRGFDGIKLGGLGQGCEAMQAAPEL
jgi:hypothetical protein